MTSLIQDLRFGWRMLVRRPLLTAVAAGSLTVGLAGAFTVFMLVNAVLLRPLPVRDPDTLALILEQRTQNLNHSFSYRDFQELSVGTHAIADVVAYRAVQATLGARDGARHVTGELVSEAFFGALGVPMRLGRGLGAADHAPGAPPVVVVNDALWQSIGGGSAPSERSITLNGTTFGIVGVTAAAFRGMQVGGDVRFWAPLRYQPVLSSATGGRDLLASPTASWLTMVGRLQNGATLEMAAAELTRRESQLPKTELRDRTRRFVVQPGAQGDSSLPATLASPLQLLMAAGALLLLVACANVAGLVMARTAERTQEFAVRTALGAGRLRVLRLLGSEALLLGFGATAAACALAWVTAHGVMPFITSYGSGVTLNLTPDWRTWVFVLGCWMGTTLLCGILPVLFSLPGGTGSVIGHGVRTSAGRRQSMTRRVLVVTQFALALGLVAAATLLGRTLINLRGIATGMDLDRIAIIEVDPTGARTGDTAAQTAERIRRYVADGLSRLAAVPGVTAVGFARVLPLDFGGSRSTIRVPDYVPAPDEEMEINFNRVSAGYFEALGLPARDGRVIDTSDVSGAPRAAVVNETMARRYWPNRRAVGSAFSMGPDPYLVVGVVPDAKYRTLREETGPSFYIAAAQHPPTAGAFHLRTAGDPAAVLPAARQALSSLDAAVPIARVRTLREQADVNVNDERLALTIAISLAAAAALLAAAGLFAAMSHAVGRRRRELGVRLALGALPRDVRRLVISEGVRLALIGSAAGVGLAVAAGQMIEGRLFGVSATDPMSLVIAMAILGGIALLAAWAPARRAGRVDPVQALRTD